MQMDHHQKTTQQINNSAICFATSYTICQNLSSRIKKYTPQLHKLNHIDNQQNLKTQLHD